MKILVDKETCIGCALCTVLAEEVFEIKGEKAQPIRGADLINAKNQKAAREAKQSCPVEAISIDE